MLHFLHKEKAVLCVLMSNISKEKKVKLHLVRCTIAYSV